MGLLSWFKGNKEPTPPAPGGGSAVSTTDKPNPNAVVSTDMNGAVEVCRPASNVDVTVFEFGSVAASSDKVTLAGYCPVSDEIEPCRWEILPASGSDAPQFRVVF
ncbi:hypothetical protein L1987_69373 [Smallanthus sonchifolius]|uniref:Uncharacterized protein n=1 Tax=Smallanthus sonchifolius TaxID=185202 RepID=A0ACB9B5D5_9ASTR|nr:hypothetical protein L1987_69373 [Smallanthus sonchifolius]